MLTPMGDSGWVRFHLHFSFPSLLFHCRCRPRNSRRTHHRTCPLQSLVRRMRICARRVIVLRNNIETCKIVSKTLAGQQGPAPLKIRQMNWRPRLRHIRSASMHVDVSISHVFAEATATTEKISSSVSVQSKGAMSSWQTLVDGDGKFETSKIAKTCSPPGSEVEPGVDSCARKILKR
jgi:hypothetical protein